MEAREKHTQRKYSKSMELLCKYFLGGDMVGIETMMTSFFSDWLHVFSKFAAGDNSWMFGVSFTNIWSIFESGGLPQENNLIIGMINISDLCDGICNVDCSYTLYMED